MLNLRPYAKKEPFLFHKDMVSSKRTPGTLEQLEEIESEIEEQYINHIRESTANTLENIVALDINEVQKTALKSLYDPRNKKIIDVKNSIITTLENRAIDLCQYCTINDVGTMDHILPKNNFPEYSVHTNNLFPCCSTCNSYKSNLWLLEGSRKFLNPYLDVLPQERYLFVELVDSEGVIDVNFILENRNEINPELFTLICSHYECLHLLERFKRSSHSVVSDLSYTIGPLFEYMSIEEITSTLTDAITKKFSYHGANHWKSVLEISLVQDVNFMSSFLD